MLASGSPRRRELLRRLFDTFAIVVPVVDEEPLPNEDPWQTAMRLARIKNEAARLTAKSALIVSADTVVAVQDTGEVWTQLAKPTDVEDAARMLRALSGREHVVITGVCASLDSGRTLVDAATTRVRFRSLDEAEIEAYASTGEPMDKAGAYAIQGGAQAFVEAIEGAKDNVVGLPLELVHRLVEQVLNLED